MSEHARGNNRQPMVRCECCDKGLPLLTNAQAVLAEKALKGRNLTTAHPVEVVTVFCQLKYPEAMDALLRWEKKCRRWFGLGARFAGPYPLPDIAYYHVIESEASRGCDFRAL